ncbi:MAG: hypothetical protein RAK21_09895 [Synechococcus sp. SP2 MAG]|nr:hypothetical protein [Synechococcus sp. SP2 MAG]
MSANNVFNIKSGRRPSLRAKFCRKSSEASNRVLELLAPGSFVTLDNHPTDLPPFQVIECRGGLCWVRQQAWGQNVQWEVEHRLLTSA